MFQSCFGYTRSFASPCGFWNQFVNFYKKACWNFDLGRIDSLTYSSVQSMNMIYLCLFRSSLISLSSGLWFSVYRSFSFLSDLSLSISYFLMLLPVILLFKKISVSSWSVLMYSNINDFHVLMFCLQQPTHI